MGVRFNHPGTFCLIPVGDTSEDLTSVCLFENMRMWIWEHRIETVCHGESFAKSHRRASSQYEAHT